MIRIFPCPARPAMALLLATGALLLPACQAPSPRPVAWAQPVRGAAAGWNLYAVDKDVYRGALPATAEASTLRALGITEILCLCEDTSPEFAGIRRTCLPLSPSGVTDAQMLTALRVLRDRRGPVLIHCRRGADRTGCVVAMYRVVMQGWSREDAIREMERGGYGFFPGWLNLVHYVRKADAARLRTALGLPARPARPPGADPPRQRSPGAQTTGRRTQAGQPCPAENSCGNPEGAAYLSGHHHQFSYDCDPRCRAAGAPGKPSHG